jgi:hypothetical protein
MDACQWKCKQLVHGAVGQNVAAKWQGRYYVGVESTTVQTGWHRKPEGGHGHVITPSLPKPQRVVRTRNRCARHSPYLQVPYEGEYHGGWHALSHVTLLVHRLRQPRQPF